MKRMAIVAISGAAIVAGACAGYVLATNAELRGRIVRGMQDVFHISKQRMDEMTEEVAIKTAKMTKNPKINQDWVEQQWEHLGY